MQSEYAQEMGTVQIRNVSDEVTQKHKAKAAAAGLSLSEYLRRELTALVDQIALDERWDAFVGNGIQMTRDEIIDSIHADRKWE